MPQFNEDEQKKKIDAIHHQEEEELARILSEKYKLSYVDLSSVAINTDALRLIPEEDARTANAASYNIVSKKVSIAVKTPNNDKIHDIIEDLQNRGYEPQLFMASTQSLERAWNLYKDLSFAVETTAGMIDVSNDSITELLNSIKTLHEAHTAIDSVLDTKKKTMTSRILETILASALALNVSDIHFEPEEMYTRMRFRLDGVLTEIEQFKPEIYKMILSRIKLLSALKLNVREAAQDGRFSIRIDGKDVQFRVSVIPGAHAESIVMRILDPTSIQVELEDMGIEETMFEMLMQEIKRPNGLILNTGPTGSGKTTTLYAFLRRIHTPDVKIITIEDPIEYRLEGIVQSQADPKKYTFAQGLRAALRQDPDVIMVGEIRDLEVAEVAIHSALTGHLVFSTLHTNSAVGAFPRLVNVGIEKNVVGSAVNLAMAQRLIRKIRPECARKVQLEGEKKAFVQSVLDTIVNKDLIPENTTHVWEAIESEDCTPPYKGRNGVFEVAQMTKEIEEVIRDGGGMRELNESVKQQGFLNMKQDGVVKALKGVTTLEEIFRVLGSETDDVVEEDDEPSDI